MNNDKLTPHDATNEQSMSKSKLKRLAIQATNEQGEQQTDKTPDVGRVPNTCGAFKSVFYAFNKRMPTDQDVWNAAVKSAKQRYAPQPEQSEQGDWVMVPREPDDNMIIAMATNFRTIPPAAYLRNAYRAMLSAAPKPTVDGEAVAQIYPHGVALTQYGYDNRAMVEGTKLYTHAPDSAAIIGQLEADKAELIDAVLILLYKDGIIADKQAIKALIAKHEGVK